VQFNSSGTLTLSDVVMSGNSLMVGHFA
jgi:hypothetical protein